MDTPTYAQLRRRAATSAIAAVSALALVAVPSLAQGDDGDPAEGEQDRESMAMDATATQWSFQLAYQMMPNYYDDTLDNGLPRPPGADNYWQLRVVAPIPRKGYTILPRLTIRHYENGQGESGFGNTELFALIIPGAWDWGTGRGGIGPIVTLPGNEDVARDEWGYGLAAAAVNTAGKWFYGLLFTQTWRAVDPNRLGPEPGTTDASPLGIAPFLNYRFGGGWYVGNGDMVALWDWETSTFYLPVGVRVGKVIVGATSSWNLYAEYQTSLIYNDWQGSAVQDSWRFNVSYTLPVGI